MQLSALVDYFIAPAFASVAKGRPLAYANTFSNSQAQTVSVSLLKYTEEYAGTLKIHHKLKRCGGSDAAFFSDVIEPCIFLKSLLTIIFPLLNLVIRMEHLFSSAEAINRIYQIKGRKYTSPLAICVGDVADIDRFAVTEHLPCGLLDFLLPGPVTVVLNRGESSMLEKSLNPGLASIAVRVPDSNFIRVIARGSGSALALTSANLSGQCSSVCTKDFQDLWDKCAFVYDGGVLPSGRAGSTIVDLTQQGSYKILRPGSAKEETIAILKRHFLVEATET